MRLRRSGRSLAEDGSSPPREIRSRVGAHEAFFRSDGAGSERLVVVYHIQKTAGTSLRRVVRANLPPADLGLDPTLRFVRRRRAELVAWHRTWYESLDEDRRRRLCCVMSHWAGYLLPSLDRPADTLAFVREPVDRTLSYYYYKQRRRGPERPQRPLEELYERGAAGSLGKPGDERWDQLCNWQSRALLSVFHDVSTLGHSAGPARDADLWRERLRDLVERVYLVGVQDRFEQYLDLLASRFGWRSFIPQSKVNPQRPAAAVAPDLRRTILAYNWLDSELYELCRSLQLRREADARA